MTGWQFIDRIGAWIAANPERWFLGCIVFYLFVSLWGF